MISFTMLDTACRAWLEFTRDSFSRSSLEISVLCISALYFSRFSNSTSYRPRNQKVVNEAAIVPIAPHPKRLKPFFLVGVSVCPVAARAICLISREIGESASASGVALICILRTEG